MTNEQNYRKMSILIRRSFPTRIMWSHEDMQLDFCALLLTHAYVCIRFRTSHVPHAELAERGVLLAKREYAHAFCFVAPHWFLDAFLIRIFKNAYTALLQYVQSTLVMLSTCFAHRQDCAKTNKSARRPLKTVQGF
jgi:hypothetical protein